MGRSHIDKHARTLFRFLILVLMSTNLFSLFHTHISIFKTSLNSYPPFSTLWHHNALPCPLTSLSHTNKIYQGDSIYHNAAALG